MRKTIQKICSMSIALLGLLTVSCQAGDELPLVGTQQRGSNSPNGDVGNLFGQGDAVLPISSEHDIPNESYPNLWFSGHGTIHHKGGSASVVQSMQAKVDADQFMYNIERFNATGGKNRKDVDKAVRQQLGRTTGERTTRERLREAAQNQSFTLANFLVYADDVAGRDGAIFNFGTPIPVFVLPAPASRYEALNNGPITFTTQVSGYVTYSLTTTVSRVSTIGDSITVRITHTIPNDNNGQAYEKFPLVYQSDFLIDMKEQIVRSIDVLTYYHYEGKRYNVNMSHSLCRADQNGEVTNFGTCS